MQRQRMTTASPARNSAGTAKDPGPRSLRGQGGHRGHPKSIADELGTRRFLFVTGKGGVGKTTVCGALALALAARGKRVLVAM